MEPEDYIEDHDEQVRDFRDPDEIGAAELGQALWVGMPISMVATPNAALTIMRRQDEDVDLRVPEQLEQVRIVHHVAAAGVGEMHPEIAVERQQRGRDRQRRAAPPRSS